MAEQIPYGVATSLVNRLASAAFREFGRIYGVMDELDRLKNTVESIKAVLLDAEEKQEQSRAVQIWVRRLKDDVFHPADNLLDEFVIEYMRSKPLKSIVVRHKVAREIENIQKKLNDVVKDMSGLNLNSNVVVVQNTNSVRRETGSFVLESDIIGREDDKKEVINLLRQPHENNNVSMVAIVGIGGLGKTALAQLVYNDGEIKKSFEKRMWVCVSDNFDVKTILKNVLRSLLPKEKIDDTLPLDNLQTMLRDKLTGMKYLLVLDDVWSESFEKWAQLRTYLMFGAQGSRVLVTTRNKTVAKTMGVSDPFVLNGLNPEESWGLLKKIITHGDETNEVNQNLQSIGKKIAEKCSGVPLAIRTLGGLLQGKSEEKEWIDILQGDFWKLCEDEESIMPVLKLSYQNLSPQLRQCFAYCSLYPKDWIWKIKKDELIQLWMAHGYLECSDENQSIEDIGNHFVKIFLMKSFFQNVDINRWGDILSFKMHDLMHDLAMKVAGNDCCYLNGETKRLVGSPVHIMLESDAFGLLESLDASRIRTLILTNKLNEKELSVISKFKYLRVLKLWECSLSKLCDSIGKMKHLRYLNLSYCRGLGCLSKSIRNLVCLQTLILSHCEEVEFSTKDISKHINLRHFEINCFIASKTTSWFGKLGVGRQTNSVIFSNWISPLTNIVEISLSSNSSSLKYLPPMERLPFLKSLSICNLGELEFIYYEEPILSESFFPSLEKLTIILCLQLRGWRRMRNDDDDNSSQSYHFSFPRLSELYLSNCGSLTHIPTFPKLDKELTFNFSNVKALEATLNMVGSIEFHPLSMLKYLKIGRYDLYLKNLQKDWLQNLTSLKYLTFKEIRTKKFHEIGIWFPNDPNYLPCLENIKFDDCRDLTALPDWICNISSLQHICIEECEYLDSLPGGMSRLAKLQTLEIIDCPLLIEECETQTSATWPKITHIPNIILKKY